MDRLGKVLSKQGKWRLSVLGFRVSRMGRVDWVMRKVRKGHPSVSGPTCMGHVD